MSDTQTQKAKKPIAIPKPNSDFYQTFQMLSETEQAKVNKVREFMKTVVAPIINDFWARDEFPFDLVPGIRDLQIAGLGFEGYDCAGGSNLLSCYFAMEIAKVDCSLATFYGVHSGLAMGFIYLCGSEEQKKRWLPPWRASKRSAPSVSRSLWWAPVLRWPLDQRTAGGRHVDSERPEEVDR